MARRGNRRGAERLPLTLKDNPPALALEVIDQPAPAAPPAQPSCLQRIGQILAGATTPLSQRQLRDAARMRTSDVSQALATLVASGRVIKSPIGYISSSRDRFRFPILIGPKGNGNRKYRLTSVS
jgi:hypothetical protein